LSSARPLEQKRILFVDDDPDIRKMFRIVLESAGATVLDAATAAELASVLEKSAVDAIVLDWHLADDSPGASLATLASLRPEMRARLLVVSGDPRVVGARASMLPAGTRAIAKPFRPGDLVVALQALLAAL
jgi:DNA-binding response OmpR family regulator